MVDGIRFADVTAAAGLEHPHSAEPISGDEGMTSGAAAADVDLDGDIDLYVTRVGLPNSLYVNNGDGTFTDTAAAAGVEGGQPAEGSTAAAFADVDGDGDVDLFVAGYDPSPTQLFINDGGGTFTDEAADRGVLLQIPEGEEDASEIHGVTFHDVDGDGWLDLMTTEWFVGATRPLGEVLAAGDDRRLGVV